MQRLTVTTAAELNAAITSGSKDIEITGEIRGLPMLTLPKGVSLRGGVLGFNAKGVRLTRDNLLDDIRIETQEHEAAIFNDTSVADLGELRLRNVVTVGQVLLLARDAVRGGHVRVDGLTVAAADLRGRFERPHGWAPGFIEVQQGGFTLWNMHTDPDVTITAELLDIAAGSADHPIRGTGVLVGGHGVYNGSGGKLAVTTLRTGEVHADSGIVPQTFDLISGGVFVVSGAEIRQVTNAGAVVTSGANQPVFDNWGDVGTWTVEQPITSHGPSGVGFVQFGSLDLLDVRAPITTLGPGGRGFNLYDGTLQHAVFDSITTHGDGGVGIVVSKPLPLLEIRGDLTTLGGEGYSLYYGVQVPLKAAALDVKQSGSIGTFRSDGRIVTKGDDVITVVIEGEIGEFSAKHGIAAEGAHSDAVHVRGTVPGLDTAEISARDGRKLVRLDTSHPMVHG